MTRNINDFLESGESDNIVTTNVDVSTNIRLDATDNPELEGMVFVVGDGGLMAIEARPTSNVVNEDYNNVNVLLTTTESDPIFSLTTTVDFTDTGDSSYKVYLAITNTNKQSKTLTISLYDDGVVRGSDTRSIIGEANALGVMFSGLLVNNIATGSNITVTLVAESDSDLSFNGDVNAGHLQLIKAPPATAIQINEALNVDYNLYVYNGNLGPSLSRAEIEASLGTDRPNICVIQDTSGHLFRVIYSSVQDKFFSTNYTEAT